ncbi:MAG: dihydropteroate synthase [Deltaproteobacteria bacterium]|nr:dihydropteroate synthase [Deltaproteobacteria bacterium]
MLRWSDYTLRLGTRTYVSGILNVTPDSFADGGLYFDTGKAIKHALEMESYGADIIDVGGESTRPYAEQVTEKEELDRVIPVIRGLSRELKVPISIDTYRAEVARQAIEAGASMINDISALSFDPEMVSVAAEAEVPIVLMHIKGTPRNMQVDPVYHDLIPDITKFLINAVDRGVKGGIREDMIIIDPGIGFGKTFDHNLEIIKNLDRFSVLDKPILFGSSRKTFIGHILGNQPHERDIGTMATLSVALLNGAHIVRVHDVRMAIDTVKVIDAIIKEKCEENDINS